MQTLCLIFPPSRETLAQSRRRPDGHKQTYLPSSTQTSTEVRTSSRLLITPQELQTRPTSPQSHTIRPGHPNSQYLARPPMARTRQRRQGSTPRWPPCRQRQSRNSDRHRGDEDLQGDSFDMECCVLCGRGCRGLVFSELGFDWDLFRAYPLLTI